jgi:hypothetical protein
VLQLGTEIIAVPLSCFEFLLYRADSTRTLLSVMVDHSLQ